jgi:hypothetical protein
MHHSEPIAPCHPLISTLSHTPSVTLPVPSPRSLASLGKQVVQLEGGLRVEQRERATIHKEVSAHTAEAALEVSS